MPLLLYTYFNSSFVFASVLVLFSCNAVLPFSLSAWGLSVYGGEANGQTEVFRLLALFSYCLGGT